LSKKASKTVIGSFVISSLALVVAGVLIFGSGEILREKRKCILFFRDSVKGLSVGAPVVFMGVKIGEVKEISVVADPTKSSFLIPVIIEVKSGKIKRFITEELGSTQKVTEYVNQLIEKGLRAQLGLQSIVTGQLQIDLDFFPEEKAVLLGINKKYQEIPTIPSKFERFTKTIEKLPLEEIVDKLSSSLNRIDALLNSNEVKEILQSMKLTLEDARQISYQLNKELKPLVNTIDEVLKAYGQLAQNLNQQIGPLSSDVDELIKVVSEASKQANITLKTIENFVEEDSVTAVELTTTLKEFSSAARSLRHLADYLNRHPEALFRGKPPDNR